MSTQAGRMRLTLARTYHKFSDRPIKQWLNWAQKGGFAIVDQGLFAGTNFIVNILLARWMSPTEYGAFATAYSIFLLLATFHTALLTEPMLIFGPGKYASVFRRYVAFLIYGHFGVTLLLGLILASISGALYVFGDVTVSPALMGLALAAPGILVLWVLRRAFYVTGQVHLAASGGALYLVLMTAGIATLHHTTKLSPFSALVMMGTAGIGAGLWLVLFLKPAWHTAESALASRTVLNVHWEYGRWASAAAALSWLPGNIYYTLLPVWHGLEASAAFKAIMNLIMPVLQINAAIGVLIVPTFVSTLQTRGREGLNQVMRRVLVIFLASSAGYWLILFVLRTEIITWLYKGQYSEYTNLLLLAGIIPFAASINTVFGGALRAMERPDRIFWCYVISTVLALTVGLALMAARNVEGALMATVLTTFATGGASLWFLSRL